MAATTDAPTITIDGVTSKPGSPITMLALTCGCHPIAKGHGYETADQLDCEHCGPAAVVNSIETWSF